MHSFMYVYACMFVFEMNDGAPVLFLTLSNDGGGKDLLKHPTDAYRYRGTAPQPVEQMQSS